MASDEFTCPLTTSWQEAIDLVNARKAVLGQENIPYSYARRITYIGDFNNNGSVFIKFTASASDGDELTNGEGNVGTTSQAPSSEDLRGVYLKGSDSSQKVVIKVQR